MNTQLTLDIGNDVVVLRGRGGKTLRFRGRWTEFYAALVAQDRGRALSYRTLHMIGLWRSSSLENVGKAVWAHQRNLRLAGYGSVLEYPENTRSWFLNRSVLTIVAPKRANLSRWLLQRQGADDPLHVRRPEQWQQWIRAGVSSFTALQQGNTEDAVDAAKTAAIAAPERLHRQVSELLLARAVQRLGPDGGAVEAVDDAIYDADGPVSEAFRDRLLAIQSVDTAPKNIPGVIGDLERRLSRADGRGDFAGVGTLLNAIAVLLRRQGALNQAVSGLERAIPLLLAAGDIVTLQSALFNLGHCLALSEYRERGEISLLAMELLGLDLEIKKRFGLGRDSAQNEVVRALFALRTGDIAAADRLTGEIRDVISRTHNPYDEGGYHRVLAKLAYVRAAQAGPLDKITTKRVLSHLRRAQQYFEKANRYDAVATARREYAKVETGHPPF